MEPSECIENRGLKQIDPIPTTGALQLRMVIEGGDVLVEIGPLEAFGQALCLRESNRSRPVDHRWTVRG